LNFTLHNNKFIIVDPNTKQLIKDAVFRQMGQANDNDTEPSHCPTVNIPSKPASRDPSQTLNIQPQPAQVQTLQFNLNQNEPQKISSTATKSISTGMSSLQLSDSDNSAYSDNSTDHTRCFPSEYLRERPFSLKRGGVMFVFLKKILILVEGKKK